uniref:WW domain binding protein 11 n=1 Tax=Mola mola TaxID=94237 RepID=A0A3Q3WQ55_MOLML
MNPTDQAEFNPVQQPLLNEKVLRDKRKKLRETFERIVHLYERENPDTYKELRKLELDYETKRGQLALYFDSVKQNAESVEVDSIPLPDMPHAPSNIHIQDIPLPGAQPPSILKKSTSFRSVRFADMPAEAPHEGKRKKKRLVKRTKAITPLQAMMLRMAQSVPEAEEEEEVEEEYTDESDNSDIEDRGPPGDNQPHLMASHRLPPPTGLVAQQIPPHLQGPPLAGPPPLGPPPAPPMRPPGPPSGPPPGPPPAPPFLRPPGMPAGIRGPLPRLLPPGPPPGRPPGPPPGPPPMPPPPPRAGGPPRPLAPPLSLFPPPLNSVLSAPPSIVQRQKGSGSNQDGLQTNLPPPAMPMRPGVMHMPPPPGTAAAQTGTNPGS